MLEESSTESIDIRIWVFDFAYFAQNAGNCIEALLSQIADVIVSDVLISESLQVQKSRIGISEDSMAITGNNSAFFQGLVNEFFD